MSMSMPARRALAGAVMVMEFVGAEQAGAHLLEDIGEGDVALQAVFAEAFDGDGGFRDDGGGGEEVAGVAGVGFDGVAGLWFVICGAAGT